MDVAMDTTKCCRFCDAPLHFEHYGMLRFHCGTWEDGELTERSEECRERQREQLMEDKESQ